MVTRNHRARAARFDHEREHDVIEYVLSQSPKGETVVHAEQVATHRVRGATYEVWDVHTKRSGRWWVISPPMNLYTQRDFPSMDKAFSFHLGLMLRVTAKNEPCREAPRDADIAGQRQDVATEGIPGSSPPAPTGRSRVVDIVRP